MLALIISNVMPYNFIVPCVVEPQQYNPAASSARYQRTPQSHDQRTPQSHDQRTPQSHDQRTPQSHDQRTPQSHDAANESDVTTYEYQPRSYQAKPPPVYYQVWERL